MSYPPHHTDLSRRAFLGDLTRLAAASGLTLQLGSILSLAACDRRPTEQFAHLSPDEAETLRAFAAQIIPSEPGAPGAEEAGAVYFVDRALGEPFFAQSASLIRDGLAELDGLARAAGARRGFASLPAATQIVVMRQVEQQPFFVSARLLVLIGTFGDPSHGGNRGGVGASLLRKEHGASYTAPFGWYDASTDAERARFAA